MKHYLITGATGVVGNAIMHALINQSDCTLYLLIRASTQSIWNNKIKSLGIPSEAEKRKIQFINGDITKKDFGVDKDKLIFLQNNIEAIIHAAADVKLNQPLASARENAVNGTKIAIAFAQSCKQLKHFNYISTVGVLGKSENILQEDKPPENIQYHNSYEQAKAEAELFVLSQMRKGFPCTIYRPSMIVGDSRTGSIFSKQIFYFICDFILRGGISGLMPPLSHFYLDTIPIDYLVSFIVGCMNDYENSVGAIFNLCAGYENACRLDQLMKMIDNSMNSLDLKVPFKWTVPLSIFQILLGVLSIISTQTTKKQIHSLSGFLNYLDSSPKFSNQKFLKVAERLGLKIKKPSEYMEIIVSSYIKDFHESKKN